MDKIKYYVLRYGNVALLYTYTNYESFLKEFSALVRGEAQNDRPNYYYLIAMYIYTNLDNVEVVSMQYCPLKSNLSAQKNNIITQFVANCANGLKKIIETGHIYTDIVVKAQGDPAIEKQISIDYEFIKQLYDIIKTCNDKKTNDASNIIKQYEKYYCQDNASKSLNLADYINDYPKIYDGVKKMTELLECAIMSIPTDHSSTELIDIIRNAFYKVHTRVNDLTDSKAGVLELFYLNIRAAGEKAKSNLYNIDINLIINVDNARDIVTSKLTQVLSKTEHSALGDPSNKINLKYIDSYKWFLAELYKNKITFDAIADLFKIINPEIEFESVTVLKQKAKNIIDSNLILIAIMYYRYTTGTTFDNAYVRYFKEIELLMIGHTLIKYIKLAIRHKDIYHLNTIGLLNLGAYIRYIPEDRFITETVFNDHENKLKYVAGSRLIIHSDGVDLINDYIRIMRKTNHENMTVTEIINKLLDHSSVKTNIEKQLYGLIGFSVPDMITPKKTKINIKVAEITVEDKFNQVGSSELQKMWKDFYDKKEPGDPVGFWGAEELNYIRQVRYIMSMFLLEAIYHAELVGANINQLSLDITGLLIKNCSSIQNYQEILYTVFIDVMDGLLGDYKRTIGSVNFSEFNGNIPSQYKHVSITTSQTQDITDTNYKLLVVMSVHSVGSLTNEHLTPDSSHTADLDILNPKLNKNISGEGLEILRHITEDTLDAEPNDILYLEVDGDKYNINNIKNMRAKFNEEPNKDGMRAIKQGNVYDSYDEHNIEDVLNEVINKTNRGTIEHTICGIKYKVNQDHACDGIICLENDGITKYIIGSNQNVNNFVSDKIKTHYKTGDEYGYNDETFNKQYLLAWNSPDVDKHVFGDKYIVIRNITKTKSGTKLKDFVVVFNREKITFLSQYKDNLNINIDEIDKPLWVLHKKSHLMEFIDLALPHQEELYNLFFSNKASGTVTLKTKFTDVELTLTQHDKRTLSWTTSKTDLVNYMSDDWTELNTYNSGKHTHFEPCYMYSIRSDKFGNISLYNTPTKPTNPTNPTDPTNDYSYSILTNFTNDYRNCGYGLLSTNYEVVKITNNPFNIIFKSNITQDMFYSVDDRIINQYKKLDDLKKLYYDDKKITYYKPGHLLYKITYSCGAMYLNPPTNGDECYEMLMQFLVEYKKNGRGSLDQKYEVIKKTDNPTNFIFKYRSTTGEFSYFCTAEDIEIRYMSYHKLYTLKKINDETIRYTE